MSCYFIAQIRIHDEAEYEKYIDGAEAVFRKYQGQYLVVDNDPTILEGEWDYTRTVMIQFPSKSDFDAWYHSDAYQTILKHRLHAADCDTILVKGVESSA